MPQLQGTPDKAPGAPGVEAEVKLLLETWLQKYVPRVCGQHFKS